MASLSAALVDVDLLVAGGRWSRIQRVSSMRIATSVR